MSAPKWFGAASWLLILPKWAFALLFHTLSVYFSIAMCIHCYTTMHLLQQVSHNHNQLLSTLQLQLLLVQSWSHLWTVELNQLQLNVQYLWHQHLTPLLWLVCKHTDLRLHTLYILSYSYGLSIKTLVDGVSPFTQTILNLSICYIFGML